MVTPVTADLRRRCQVAATLDHTDKPRRFEMRITTLAAAVFVLAAPAMSMADTVGDTSPFAGGSSVAPMVELNPGAKEINSFVPVSKYWRCPRRRGQKVTHMTFRHGRAPLCHYKRINYGWRATRAAWRHCRLKYGRRVIRALESRTQYRCIYRQFRA
jgi:hypothetical protein